LRIEALCNAAQPLPSCYNVGVHHRPATCRGTIGPVWVGNPKYAFDLNKA